LASIYTLGHTGKDFSIEDNNAVSQYREYYLRNSLRAGEIIEEIFDMIKIRDSDAIVYIFGDHGPYRSRGNASRRFEADPQFFVHDRFAVLGGIFPKGRCATYVRERDKKPFSTSIHGAEAIFKCFTGGSYKNKEQDDQIVGIFGEGINIKFEE